MKANAKLNETQLQINLFCFITRRLNLAYIELGDVNNIFAIIITVHQNNNASEHQSSKFNDIVKRLTNSNQPLHRSINMRYSQLVFFFLLAFTVGIIQGWHDESSKNGEVQQIRPHLPTHDIHDEFQPRPGKTLGGRKTLTKERGEQIEKEAHLNHKKVIEEMNNRFKDYKENCFPRPKKGCRCTQADGGLIQYDKDEDCRIKILK